MIAEIVKYKPLLTDPRFINLSNKVFGRWVVLGYCGQINANSSWHCRCECGTEKLVYGTTLRDGRSTSCGCSHNEQTSKSKTTHGMTRLPEYLIWKSMIARCRNTNNKSYKNYGGRGIVVCNRWEKFANFISDMGLRPSPELTLERKNNDKGYCPSNCIWASRRRQSRNKRCTRKLKLRGICLPIADWSEKLNVNYFTVYRWCKSGFSEKKIIELLNKNHSERASAWKKYV